MWLRFDLNYNPLPLSLSLSLSLLLTLPLTTILNTILFHHNMKY